MDQLPDVQIITLHKVPVSKKIAFALGQTGWCLASFGVTQCLIFFYAAPENGERLFGQYMPQGSVGRIFTYVGLIAFLGIFLWAFLDPLTANISERVKAKYGTRKLLLAISIVPAAIFSVLIFSPVVPHASNLNIVWLLFCIVSLYFFISLYTTSYNAWINELSTDDDDRLQLVMIMSITYAIGIGLGYGVYSTMSLLQHKYGSEQAFKFVILLFGILSTVFMLIPVLFVNDKDKVADEPAENVPLSEMLRHVFANPNFKVFAFVEMLYWFPNTILTIALPYFVTILLQIDKAYASYILYAAGLGSFLLYGLIGKWVKKYGKRKLILIAFVLTMVSFSFTATLGLFPINIYIVVAIFVLLNAVPVAIFSILPMDIVGEIAQKDGEKTGVYKNAAFYGMKSFMMKIGVSVTNLVFPSLLLLGNTPQHSIGVRSVAIACVLISVVGFFVMRKYRDYGVVSRKS
ncbi:MAG: Na+/melibiose symporter-like transporter [Bacteroidota bacterium]|nr:Na+/melibiose symporter-like transporter [Bacteroidota bacterium]